MAKTRIVLVLGRGCTVRDDFKESDHPRAEGGKFGSGGGSGASAEKTKTSVSALKSKLEAMPHARLVASLNNKQVDPAVKKHIEKELDSRANRGTSKGLGEK